MDRLWIGLTVLSVAGIVLFGWLLRKRYRAMQEIQKGYQPPQMRFHYTLKEVEEECEALGDKGRALLRQFEGVYMPKDAVAVTDAELAGISRQELEAKILDQIHNTYRGKEAEYGEKLMREAERVILLRVVDEYWMDHIDAMTDLRQGIGLRAYGQHNPVDMYKKEGFDMFEGMTNAIREETVRRLFAFQIRKDEEIKRQKVAKETSAATHKN